MRRNYISYSKFSFHRYLVIMVKGQGNGHGPLDVVGEPPRQGVQRASQAVNTLLQKTELGKVIIFVCFLC